MKLTYHQQRRDLLFGRMSLMVRNKVLLVFSIGVIGFMTFAVCSGEAFQQANLLARFFFIIFSLVFATLFYVSVQLVIQLFMVLFSKNVGLLGTHQLEIKDEGLEESTAVNKSIHRWNPSFSVKESGRYVWIFPTDGHYFLIPKRRNGHEGDLTEFIIQLKSKISQ